ncbi:conserved exported hypothetical protein [uncultured Desulfobacterium sp.]|uniref:Haem-binding uptake Tiki superfamily ChaN domain-containing protein n=1 Tax=uncultured Desulfobacterium sp. TaxID=201089 RepID=A0A445N0W0_9BACT|nr:conserved exported hypothetical protein [uncultured Desulfobacterium sp.]
MSMKSSLGLCLVLALLAVTGGCSIMRHNMPPLAKIDGMSRHFSIGRIIKMETGETLSFEQMIARIESSDLIFIGEVHDNPEHHLIQVQILQALIARRGPLTVAMECFQKMQQPAIDRYLAGEITEGEFLDAVDWDNQWSFDYSLYRPLVLEVKDKGGKILAINAQNGIVRKVARSGLDSLSADERSKLAGEIDLSHERHRNYLAEVFDQEAHKHLKNFDNFYQAQCVWEDTMAENIAQSIKNAQMPVVVFVGNGHIVNKFGIPDRTIKRQPAKMATIMLTPIEGQTTLARESADYVWLTSACSRRMTIHPRFHQQQNQDALMTRPMP